VDGRISCLVSDGKISAMICQDLNAGGRIKELEGWSSTIVILGINEAASKFG
jgi:hypothetical protein